MEETSIDVGTCADCGTEYDLGAGHECSHAGRYTQTIVQELETLNEALRHDARRDGSLSEWLRLVAELGLDCDRVQEDGGVFSSWLNANALDLSVKIDTRGVEYGAVVEVTRTIGGPGCWIRHDTNDGSFVEVLTVWGGERSTETICLKYVAEELAALAEIY